MESKLQKLPALERSAANSYLSSKITKGFYSILDRKGKMKETIEKTYKHVKQVTSTLKDKKNEVISKYLRKIS